MPDWLLATGFVVGGLSIWFAVAYRNTRRPIAATLARRANQTREEFMQMMAPDCSYEAASFLWDTALFYLEPRLTPHPDDNLLTDLPILHNDWSEDGPRDFARAQGFHESNFPDWPEGWPITIRNYGRWLSIGPV